MYETGKGQNSAVYKGHLLQEHTAQSLKDPPGITLIFTYGRISSKSPEVAKHHISVINEFEEYSLPFTLLEHTS